MEATNNIITYIKNNWWQLGISFLLGLCIGYFLYYKIIIKINKSISDAVMAISFVIAIFCLISGIFFDKQIISMEVLSFYSSFIFSWLLTKNSSKEELKENLNEIAKMIHRHISDVKEAALITKERLNNIRDKGKTDTTDIEGIIDNISIIIKNIENIEQDWFDMLSEDEKEKTMKKKEDNPEDHRKSAKEVSQPAIQRLKRVLPKQKEFRETEQQPEKLELEQQPEEPGQQA